MVVKCKLCDKEFQVSNDGIFLCPFCGASHEITPKSILTKIPVQGELFEEEKVDEKNSTIPWENASRGRYFKSFFETLTMVVSKPTHFFNLINDNLKVKNALIYGVLISTLVTVTSSLLQQFWFSSVVNFFTIFFKRGFDFNHTSELLLINLIISPFISLFVILFTSIMYHTLLSLFARGINFQKTIKIISYGSTSANIFSLIPIIGGILSFVYSIYLSITGLSIVHKVSKSRVVVAVLLPLIVTLMLFLLFAFTFLFKFMRNY